MVLGRIARVCPAKTSTNSNRGWIVPICGGEKKVQSSAILNRFVGLCGGPDAKIAIIPTASQLEDSGARYFRPINERLGSDQQEMYVKS